MTEVLGRRSPISVKVEDTTVILTIGSRSVSLDYNTAIDLAVMLRGYGKVAKQNAGDLSIRAIGFANLTDATLDELKVQKRRDGTAAFDLRR